MLNRVALRWVTELLGLPGGTGGGFVTGATMANATCLAAARDAVLAGHGWDAAGQGLIGDACGQASSRFAMISALAAGVAASMQTRSMTLM